MSSEEFRNAFYFSYYVPWCGFPQSFAAKNV